MMTEDEYMKNRIEDQIAWYSTRASQNKQKYYLCNSTIIIVSALITSMSGFDFYPTAKNLLLGLMGALIAIVTGLSSLYKFHEKWTEYRVTAEAMLQEKFFFATLTGPYDKQEEPLKVLVSRIENLISKENSTWKQYTSQVIKPSETPVPPSPPLAPGNV